MLRDNKDDQSDSSNSEEQEVSNEIKNIRPTLDLIEERGYVRCGIYGGAFGFGSMSDVDDLTGFNTDQCGIVATALFGNSSLVETVMVTPENRFPMLANGSIDMLGAPVTHTMNRDIYDPLSNTGFAFSTPWLYSGTAFGGDSTLVDCAEKLDSFYGDCRKLKICVSTGSTQYVVLQESELDGSALVVTDTPEKGLAFLLTGICNVVASEPLLMETFLLASGQNQSSFKIGKKLFSKEPLSVVTREDDPEWSSLVDLSINILYLAEAHNISKSNSQEMASFFSDDPDIAAKAVSIISEYGNYGDLYQKNIERFVPRAGLNSLYIGGGTGLLYALPFGDLRVQGPGPMSNMTLQTIMDRGSLRCGVIPRPGFAELNSNGSWSGFDIEFCLGIAGAMFYGQPKMVEFVNATQDSGSAFSSLAQNQVDVVAGARVTIQAGYREPTTGKGFVFSAPTFYDNDSGDAFAFATSRDDHQWSDFVYWITSGIIYAEEKGITQETSTNMPVTSLFGEEGLKQMFKDTIYAVGSYGEIYNRTLANSLPRSGGNLLNELPYGPQQYPLSVY